MPFMTMTLASSSAPMWPMYFRPKNHSVMSSRPRPTTVKPMTEPEENATFRPRLRLSCAALAVRALAFVAIFMPMRPASIDQMPPVRNANGVIRESISPLEANAMISRITKTMAKTLATVVYWRLR